jgi:hypothetical protein
LLAAALGGLCWNRRSVTALVPLCRGAVKPYSVRSNVSYREHMPRSTLSTGLEPGPSVFTSPTHVTLNMAGAPPPPPPPPPVGLAAPAAPAPAAAPPAAPACCISARARGDAPPPSAAERRRFRRRAGATALGDSYVSGARAYALLMLQRGQITDR